MLGIQTARKLFTPVAEAGDYDPEDYIESGDRVGFESQTGQRYEGTVSRYDVSRDVVIFYYWHPTIKDYVRGEKSPADLYLISKHN